MADDDTRQMFRELLATQKEYLELLRQISETQQGQAQAYRDSFERTEKEFIELARRQNEKYEAQVELYAEARRRDEQQRQATDAASRIANLIRAVALIGIAAVLAYLVLFGLHKH